MFVAETNQRPSVALPVALIVAVSAAAVCFLLWLLYLHHPLDASVARLRFLPRSMRCSTDCAPWLC